MLTSSSDTTLKPCSSTIIKVHLSNNCQRGGGGGIQGRKKIFRCRQLIIFAPQAVQQYIQQSILEKELLYFAYEAFGITFVDPVSE